MNRTLSIFVRRLGSLLATLVVMSFVIFMLVEIMPGDVAQMILGQSATEEWSRHCGSLVGSMIPCCSDMAAGSKVWWSVTWAKVSTCRVLRSIRSYGDV